MADAFDTLEPPTVESTLAVVLGASEYPRKPAWTNPVLGASARAVRDYLRSPSGLAMRPAQLLDLFEAPDGPPDQLLQIAAFLSATGGQARDLIVYYVGHGCFDHDDYCLGIRATERDKEFISTLESRKLARIIREGFARKRVYVILDSCFAASAARDWQGDEIAVAVRKMSQPLPREGTAFLAAASKYDVARAPRDGRYTVFTGAVLDALTSGVDRAQPRLSLHDVYEEVRERLRRQVSDSDAKPELHAPSQQEGDVSRLALFPNPAFVRRVEAERARAEAEAEAARARAEESERARVEAVAAARSKAEEERLRAERARAEVEAARARAEESERTRVEALAVARGKAEADADRVRAEEAERAREALAQAQAEARAQAEDARERRRWALEEQARAEVAVARAEVEARNERARQAQLRAPGGHPPPPTSEPRRFPPAPPQLRTPPNPDVAAEPNMEASSEPPLAQGVPTLAQGVPTTSPRPPPEPLVDSWWRWIIAVAGAGLAVALVASLLRGRAPGPSPSRDAGADAYVAPLVVDAYAAPPVFAGTPPVGRAAGCPDGMVHVAAGTFQMGSPDGAGDSDEHPQHAVTLSAYCIDQTEVTVQAYVACVQAKRCPALRQTVQWANVSADDVKRWSQFCRDDLPNHPINCVDWNQADAYCKWADKRLPTEAEWEYAARGADGRVSPWGNEPPTAQRLNACGPECVAMGKRVTNADWAAMYAASDGWETTAPVGSFPSGVSPFGALDMAGNVSEWTADWYGAYGKGPEPNPHGAKTGDRRVVRGGGWIDGDAGLVRAADRDGYGASDRYFFVGFRCARGD